MGVAMADSVGDRLHNVMHSMGTDSATGRITVCYTGIKRRLDTVVIVQCNLQSKYSSQIVISLTYSSLH